MLSDLCPKVRLKESVGYCHFDLPGLIITDALFLLLNNLNVLFPFSAQVHAGKSLPAMLASLRSVGPHHLIGRKQNHFIASGEKSP